MKIIRIPLSKYIDAGIMAVLITLIVFAMTQIISWIEMYHPERTFWIGVAFSIVCGIAMACVFVAAYIAHRYDRFRSSKIVQCRLRDLD